MDLVEAHHERARVLAEHRLTAADLDRVAGGRGGAVGVDVLHVLGLHAGVRRARASSRAPRRRRPRRERSCGTRPRRRRSRRARRGSVRRAGGVVLASRGPACRRLRRSRSRPVRVERPAGSRWVVVPGGQCPHGLPKPAIAIGVIVASRAARDDDVGVAGAGSAQRFADRVRARGAGRDGAEVRALEPELDRHLAGRHVADHHRDEERADAVGTLLEQDLVLRPRRSPCRRFPNR